MAINLSKNKKTNNTLEERRQSVLNKYKKSRKNSNEKEDKIIYLSDPFEHLLFIIAFSLTTFLLYILFLIGGKLIHGILGISFFDKNIFLLPASIFTSFIIFLKNGGKIKLFGYYKTVKEKETLSEKLWIWGIGLIVYSGLYLGGFVQIFYIYYLNIYSSKMSTFQNVFSDFIYFFAPEKLPFYKELHVWEIVGFWIFVFFAVLSLVDLVLLTPFKDSKKN